MCDLSIVLPIYNEAENIPRLYAELMPVLEGIGRSFEIIAVDDGSRDDSFARLTSLCGNEHRMRVVRLRRNFGQTAAFAIPELGRSPGEGNSNPLQYSCQENYMDKGSPRVRHN